MKELKKFFRHIVCSKLDLSNSVIICNNCIGGFLYSDFSQEFLSPTINLQIEAEGFLKLCANLEEYLGEELIEDKNPENEKIFKKWNTHPFPIAHLKDIKIFFQHYNSFPEAKSCWEKRSARMLEKIRNGAQVNIIMIQKDFGGGDTTNCLRSCLMKIKYICINFLRKSLYNLICQIHMC